MSQDLVFRFLTEDEKSAIRADVSSYIVVALDDNKIVSIHGFSILGRYINCSSCTGNCAEGSLIVWTRPEYRRQGIFKSMHEWAVEEAGFDKVYGGGNQVPLADGLGIQWRYNFEKSKSMVTSPSFTMKDNELQQIEYIAMISEELGFDN
jgi:GNAT superfamily N-acetyltransferase